jgi:hypothetical protein
VCRIFDLVAEELRELLSMEYTDSIRHLAFRPEGGWLAASWRDGWLRLGGV